MSEAASASGSALAPWLQRQLSELLVQPGHARLLHGPSGLGQFALGLALVRSWLCEQPTAQGACGTCPACHGVDVHTHADLCVLLPEAVMIELGWPLSEKAQSEIDNKTRKPSREIRVEAMRDMVEFGQRTSARGRGKAVLIYPAERMNAVTANTLLKTLEEPAGDLRFVLCSEAGNLLMPTIRSRCHGHAMAWPDTAAALAWLHAQGVAPASGAVLLRAAGGRPDDALQLWAAGIHADTWLAVPKMVASGQVGVFAKWAPALVVSTLQKVCHDLLAVHFGGAPRFFAATDLPKAASAYALSAWAKSLTQSLRDANHPFNPGLMHEALVCEAQNALNSRH